MPKEKRCMCLVDLEKALDSSRESVGMEKVMTKKGIPKFCSDQ